MTALAAPITACARVYLRRSLRSFSSSRPVVYSPPIIIFVAVKNETSRYGRPSLIADALQSARIWRKFSIGICGAMWCSIWMFRKPDM